LRKTPLYLLSRSPVAVSVSVPSASRLSAGVVNFIGVKHGGIGDKFRAVFDLEDSTSKKFYDDLVEIRRQHRNFIAHGSFGKRGEAFTFHSGAGAAPVLLPHQRGSQKFTLSGPLTVEDPEAIRVIRTFMDHLWAGVRAPARIYLQRSSLPAILTLATAVTYANVLKGIDEMEALVAYLTEHWDRSANMDW